MLASAMVTVADGVIMSSRSSSKKDFTQHSGICLRVQASMLMEFVWGELVIKQRGIWAGHRFRSTQGRSEE